jgi:hypothetical protein
VACVDHLPERRCDLDSGASLLAFVCARCGCVGFRAFTTPKHPIAWRGLPKETDRARFARQRFDAERAHLSRPPLVPPSFTRALAISSREPRT